MRRQFRGIKDLHISKTEPHCGILSQKIYHLAQRERANLNRPDCRFMAAKKRKTGEPLSSPPAPAMHTEQHAATVASPSTPALLTEHNEAASDSPSIPTDRVTIPIDPYPGIDEPYLQSFELLRNNAYQAVFSLGRLANAFRFSQFLYYHRMPGGRLGIPPDFLNSISDCLRLLDNDTRSELVTLLLISMKSHVIPPDQDEPFDFESLWRESVQLQDPELIPFFRHSISNRYRFSLDTRAEPWQTSPINDQSGWLDCFESLYEKLLQGDRHLANWMLQGWNVDRLVRPELKIELLTIYYEDPRPHSTFEEPPITDAIDHSPFYWTRMRCRLKAYITLNPTDRNYYTHSIFSALGSSSIAPEQPQSSVEFETSVSKWVRLLADEQLQASPISTPKGSLAVPNATYPQLNELVTYGDGSHPSHSQGVGEKLADNELMAIKDRQNALPPSFQQLNDLAKQKHDPESPLDSRNDKQKRNDWLLDKRGLENDAKLTLPELANLLTKKAAETGWVSLEWTSIRDALIESYKRQYQKSWPFDARGKKRKRGNKE